MLIHRLNTAVAAVTATTTAMTSFLGFLVFAIALATSMMATTVSAYGGVSICTGPNHTGDCYYRIYPINYCSDVPTAWFRNARTFQPEGAAGFYCYVYSVRCNETCTSASGCTIGAVDYDWPYAGDMALIGWDKLISSFKCSW